jgi:hypothetical protein
MRMNMDYLDGKITNAFIRDKCLSPEEVKALMDSNVEVMDLVPVEKEGDTLRRPSDDNK